MRKRRTHAHEHRVGRLGAACFALKTCGLWYRPIRSVTFPPDQSHREVELMSLPPLPFSRPQKSPTSHRDNLSGDGLDAFSPEAAMPSRTVLSSVSHQSMAGNPKPNYSEAAPTRPGGSPACHKSHELVDRHHGAHAVDHRVNNPGRAAHALGDGADLSDCMTQLMGSSTLTSSRKQARAGRRRPRL